MGILPSERFSKTAGLLRDYVMKYTSYVLRVCFFGVGVVGNVWGASEPVREIRVAIREAVIEEKSGALECVLRARSADMDMVSLNNVPPLLWAVITGNTRMATALLRAKAFPMAGDVKGRIPLLHAAAAGNYEMVQLLLKEGGVWPQISAITSLGESVLLATMANNQDSEMFELLLQHGSHTVDNKSVLSVAPLLYAANNNYVALVQLLLRAKAFVDIKGKDGETALRCAAEKGHCEVMRQLIDAKASVELADQRGLTPLMGAIEHGNTESVSFLLDVGARTDYRDCGRNPLRIALRRQKSDVIKLLLHAGRPDIERQLREKDEYGGSTRLIDAIAYRVSFDIVLEILEKGKHLVNVQADDGDTALMWAAETSNKQAINLLLAAGANVLLRGSAALDRARWHLNREIIDILKTAERRQGNQYGEDEVVYV